MRSPSRLLGRLDRCKFPSRTCGLRCRAQCRASRPCSPEPSADLRFVEEMVRDSFINAVRFKQIGNASSDCYIGRAFMSFCLVFPVNLSRFLWRGRTLRWRPGAGRAGCMLRRGLIDELNRGRLGVLFLTGVAGCARSSPALRYRRHFVPGLWVPTLQRSLYWHMALLSVLRFPRPNPRLHVNTQGRPAYRGFLLI